MNLPLLKAFLTESVEGAFYPNFCRFNMELDQYKKTASLIQACGHDTADLVLAIAAVERAVIVLKAEREGVVRKFKTEGVCCAVDESKQTEMGEEDRLC
jgi:hypothetical protein